MNEFLSVFKIEKYSWRLLPRKHQYQVVNDLQLINTARYVLHIKDCSWKRHMIKISLPIGSLCLLGWYSNVIILQPGYINDLIPSFCSGNRWF